MRLATLTTKKEAWFPLTDDKDGAEFLVGLLTPKENDDVDSKSTSLVMGSDGQTFRLDHTLSGSLRASLALKGWRKVYEDAEGEKDLKFTPTNKAKLLGCAPGLKAFVLEKLRELEEQYQSDAEEERKNS